MAAPVALITGGATGIGFAVAARLRASGATVVLASRRPEALFAAKGRLLCHAGPGAVEVRPLDVTDAAACDACVADVCRTVGVPAFVVHSAGATLNRLALRTSSEDMAAMFAVNCAGPVAVAKASLRHGMLRQGGVHVAIGSIVGLEGNAGQVAYAASKGALHSAFMALGKEYGGRGVRFNVVAPGLVDTDMADTVSASAREAWAARSALRRTATPEDVAQAVDLALRAGYMNAAVLPLGGG